MKVRITHTLAELIDGIDLSHVSPGEVVDLPARDAVILIAEGWALPSGGDRTVAPPRAEATDRERRPRRRRP